MKKTLLFLILSLVFIAAASDDKKVFTQAEMDEAVKKEVERQVDIIKKKSLSTLSKELLEKERMLKEKESKQEVRAEQLQIGERSLLKKIEELESSKQKILGCIDDHKQNSQMRIRQLVEVISNMKPQKAADLLSVQDSTISVKLIEKIDPQKASKIFNLMDKEVSARLQKQYLNMQK